MGEKAGEEFEARSRGLWAGGLWAIGLLIAAHFCFLGLFFGAAISTPDANGYMAQARLIAQEGRTDIRVESPAQYVGDHWMAVAEGRYYGQYPPGLPAMVGFVFRPFGPMAALWVIPVMGSLSLLGVYLVAREWVGAGWALLAAGLMAVNPFANQHALGADSHTAVCFFLIWSVFGLIRWERTRGAGWAALTGACLGLIPTIRYAESLFLIPFGIYVLTSVPRDGRWWRSVVAGAVCAGVPLVALAARNQQAFGAFWRTGYSVSGEQTGFGLGYFAQHAIPYLLMLLGLGVGLVFPVGVKGMVELCRRADTKRQGWFLVALVVPITLLYMAYYWHADSKSMRFLLPTFAFYTLAAVWLLKLRSETEPERAKKWARILAVATLTWGLPYSMMALSRLQADNQALAEVTRVIEQQVEPGSLLVAQAGVQQHLDFVGKWRLAAEEAFDRPARPERPVGPQMMERGPRAGVEEAGTVVTRAERARGFRREIKSWSGNSRKVYWLTSEAKLRNAQGRLEAEGDEFRVVEQVKLKAAPRRMGPPPGRGERGPGRGQPPPPPCRGGPPGLGGGMPPPPRFEVPEDGKLVLVEWKIQGEAEQALAGNVASGDAEASGR